jgi:uncharacterized protein (DUF488 family)
VPLGTTGRHEPATTMMTIITIGVYMFDAPRFLQSLRAADVTQLIDVRQRRGVRGPAYAWANSRRLQAMLHEAGIGYRHLRALAPTTELRHLQYEADARGGVGKRSRHHLDPAYIARYRAEIISDRALAELIAGLPSAGRAALLCVENEPAACHRSLIAAELATRHGFAIEHVRPETAATAPRW